MLPTGGWNKWDFHVVQKKKKKRERERDPVFAAKVSNVYCKVEKKKKTPADSTCSKVQ